MAAKKSSPLIEGGLLGRAAPMQMATAPAVRPPVVATPPPAVVAPAQSALPSWADYLAQQQAAFQPQQVEGWNPFNSNGSGPYTAFDPSAAFNAYANAGGTVELQAFLDSQSYEPLPSDSFSAALSRVNNERLGDSAALQWLAAYNPEIKALGAFSEDNKNGYLVHTAGGGQRLTTRRRPDLGDRWFEYRPINPDGSLGEARTEYQPKSGGLGDFIKTVAPIALSAFGAPYLATAFGGGLGATIGAGALTGAAGSAIAGGDPLKGAVMGGIGGGIGYGVNNSGLLGSVGDATSGVGTLPADLGLQPLTPINPVEITLQPLQAPVPGYNFSSPNFDMAASGLVMNPITNTAVPGFTSPPSFNLPSADLTSPGLSGSQVPVSSAPPSIDLGSGLLSPTLPGYDLSSANFPPTPAPGYSIGNPSLELPGGSLNLPPSNPLMDSLLPSVGVNQPPPVVPATPTPTRALDSQLANEQLGIKPGENSVAPSTPAVEADPSLIERGVATGRQLLAAGKDAEFYKWVTDPANSLYVRAMMMGGGALLNTVGGESKSGGPSYKDDGYRPTIGRGGWQSSIPAPGGAAIAPGGPGMAPGGFGSGITLPTTGQANDGLWRYAGNRPGGFLPSLSAAMPRHPQTSLISPPPMAPQTGLINPPASYDPNPTGPLLTNLPPMQYGYDDPVPPNQASLTPEQQRLMSPLLGLLNTNPAPRGWM